MTIAEGFDRLADRTTDLTITMKVVGTRKCLRLIGGRDVDRRTFRSLSAEAIDALGIPNPTPPAPRHVALVGFSSQIAKTIPLIGENAASMANTPNARATSPYRTYVPPFNPDEPAKLQASVAQHQKNRLESSCSDTPRPTRYDEPDTTGTHQRPHGRREHHNLLIQQRTISKSLICLKYPCSKHAFDGEEASTLSSIQSRNNRSDTSSPARFFSPLRSSVSSRPR